MIVSTVSQSGLFRLLDESRQLISSISLSLSCQQLQGQLLERRAAGVTLVTTSLSLSLN